jgi:Beta-L-arabinofuranosidase, GH127
MMQAVMDRIGQDGLAYYPPVSPDHPANTVCAWACGRIILAMADRYDRDGNPIWIDRIRKMAQGLDRIAIRRHHYAYYPLESGYSPDGTWKFTARGKGRAEFFPYTAPDEPAREQQGHEGSVKFDMAVAVRGLIKAYQLTREEQFLEISRLLTNWCLLPTMWEDGWEWGIAGHEHGLFTGHFHGNTMALRGILEYAIVAGDEKIKGIMREAYEHGRYLGLARVGWFPAWVTPERFGRPAWVKTICETCGIADMVALAVALSDAGIGDYWDDVDHYVRNQLVEQQFVDGELMLSIAAAARAKLPKQDVRADLDLQDPWAKDSRDVPERMVGCFTGGGPSNVEQVTGGGCCTGNGSLALYYAWESIVRYRDGQATVNLLLNRASPWVDVNSSLPYEGRVQVINNTARSVAVRIPGWVKMDSIKCLLAGTEVKPSRIGRYLGLEGLRPGQIVELRFDLPEDQTEYSINHQVYKYKFRGSTVIDVTPRPASDLYYPLYRRQQVKAGPAPIIKRERFVSKFLRA